MSRRELVRALLPVGMLVMGLSVLLRRGDWPTRLMTGVEALTYFAALTLVLSRKAVRSHLHALPRLHRAILAISFALILAGHFANDTRATFPFSAWSMYGRTESPSTLVYYRSVGIDLSLQRVVVNEAELFPSIGRSAIASKVKQLAAQALAPRRRAGEGIRQRRLTDWLRAVGNAYNLTHPERPVVAVELVQYSVPLRGSARPEPAGQSVWRVELDGVRPR